MTGHELRDRPPRWTRQSRPYEDEQREYERERRDIDQVLGQDAPPWIEARLHVGEEDRKPVRREDVIVVLRRPRRVDMWRNDEAGARKGGSGDGEREDTGRDETHV